MSSQLATQDRVVPTLLTVRELRDIFRVSRTTIYRWIGLRRLRRIGKVRAPEDYNSQQVLLLEVTDAELATQLRARVAERIAAGKPPSFLVQRLALAALTSVPPDAETPHDATPATLKFLEEFEDLLAILTAESSARAQLLRELETAARRLGEDPELEQQTLALEDVLSTLRLIQAREARILDRAHSREAAPDDDRTDGDNDRDSDNDDSDGSDDEGRSDHAPDVVASDRAAHDLEACDLDLQDAREPARGDAVNAHEVVLDGDETHEYTAEEDALDEEYLVTPPAEEAAPRARDDDEVAAASTREHEPSADLPERESDVESDTEPNTELDAEPGTQADEEPDTEPNTEAGRNANRDAEAVREQIGDAEPDAKPASHETSEHESERPREQPDEPQRSEPPCGQPTEPACGQPDEREVDARRQSAATASPPSAMSEPPVEAPPAQELTSEVAAPAEGTEPDAEHSWLLDTDFAESAEPASQDAPAGDAERAYSDSGDRVPGTDPSAEPEPEPEPGPEPPAIDALATPPDVAMPGTALLAGGLERIAVGQERACEAITDLGTHLAKIADREPLVIQTPEPAPAPVPDVKDGSAAVLVAGGLAMIAASWVLVVHLHTSSARASLIVLLVVNALACATILEGRRRARAG